jgi:hypothetical protein
MNLTHGLNFLRSGICFLIAGFFVISVILKCLNLRNYPNLMNDAFDN